MIVNFSSESFHDELLREAAEKVGFISLSLDTIKTFLANYTKWDKLRNWEAMSISTAQVGAATASVAMGVTFDGRYIYYAPSADTLSFMRFDTTQSFQNSSAWERMSKSVVVGTSTVCSFYSSKEGGFDGRYIYFSPLDRDNFVRFDTKRSFTDVASWEKISVSTAQVGSYAAGGNNYGCIFDGRYIYQPPCCSDTFVRFDTTLSFTNSSAWEKMSLSTAQGAALLDYAYGQGIFDGRYVYYMPYNSDTFLRFDTTKSFTNSSAWEQMSMSTAQGGDPVDSAAFGAIFDGRYVYFGAYNTLTMLRFDTTKSFTNSSAWEKMSTSTIRGSSGTDFGGVPSYDGRYVYYGTFAGASLYRFDTTKSFTNSSSWEAMSRSVICGTSTIGNMWGTASDGKYVYYAPYVGTYFFRARILNTEIGRR